MTEPDYTVTSFKIDKKVLKHIQNIAELESRPVSSIIRALLAEGTGLTTLKLHAKEHHIAESVKNIGLQLLENLKHNQTPASA